MEHTRDLEFITDIIKLIWAIIVYFLRGFSYKALLNNYMGFIPFFGDIICKNNIAKEYENPYKNKYLTTSILLMIIPVVLFFLIIAFILTGFIDIENINFNALGLIIIFLVIIAIASIVLSIINLYYTYKILYPLIQDIVWENEVGLSTFLFSFFPFVFYIWLLVKSNGLKQKEEL